MENNGQDSNMRNSERGLSLLEITIAVFICALAIVPIYHSLAFQSAAEVDATKLAMAKSILSTLRQEIMSRPFEDLKRMTPTGGEGELAGQPYPLTLEKVLETQKEFKDFDLIVYAKFSGTGDKIIQVRGEVIWTDANQTEKKESLSFLHVSHEEEE